MPKNMIAKKIKRDVWKTYAYQFLKKNIGSQEATVQDLAM